MGGAAGTAVTAVAVPLLGEVRQTRFILVNLTNLGSYVMANRFFRRDAIA